MRRSTAQALQTMHAPQHAADGAQHGIWYLVTGRDGEDGRDDGRYVGAVDEQVADGVAENENEDRCGRQEASANCDADDTYVGVQRITVRRMVHDVRGGG